MDCQDTDMSQQGALTPTQEPRMSTPTPTSRHSRETLPETPETTQIAEPPTQPPNPPKIRIKRRRAIFPPNDSSLMFASSDDLPLPTIELPESASEPAPPMINTGSAARHGYLAPSASSSFSRLASPPRTPVHQISTGVEEYESNDKDWSITPQRHGETIERPLSALSVFSDSSVSSRSSSDTSPSFGGSCTSPESEASDPFVFPEITGKPLSLMSSPIKLQAQKSRKRQKTQQKVKWSNDMDEHLWVTYMAYLSDPTVTPFKTLPGSAPPLGVCHRVAREAKRTWKGAARGLLQPISEDRSSYQFKSLDSAIMRESSAPPRTATDADSSETIRVRPLSQRSHSSNEVSRKPASKWPRSEASTRRRLRELCKYKPMLPPHYQRLMQTRTPSPFESSSSRRQRSSRLSPQPSSSVHQESSFATRDLNFSLATSTSTTMRPGGPLSQLASDARTPRQSDISSSNQGSVRGAHQKSQSLQLGLGLSSEGGMDSMRMLASPFQGSSKRDDRQNHENEQDREPAQDTTTTVKLDSPLKIHAPRPMSGSMKRRAEYQLGEELIADDVNARRDFLEGLFRDTISDGHRRVRSRGFSLGAMRQVSQPNRHLSDLFTPPSVQEDAPAPMSNASNQSVHQHSSSDDNMFAHHENNVAPHLAPPLITHHARRLGSPFAPSSGFTNTFPRSLLPPGLDSMSARDHPEERNHPHSDSTTRDQTG